jgi:hypothetical protein
MIESITTASSRLVTQSGLSMAYPVASGVYALTERAYSIGTRADGQPVLMLAIDSAAAQEFALGVERLDLRYRLEDGCPSCRIVDLPANTSEWRIVKEVLIGVRSRATGTGGASSPVVLAADGSAKPRNLIP